MHRNDRLSIDFQQASFHGRGGSGSGMSPEGTSSRGRQAVRSQATDGVPSKRRPPISVAVATLMLFASASILPGPATARSSDPATQAEVKADEGSESPARIEVRPVSEGGTLRVDYRE